MAKHTKASGNQLQKNLQFWSQKSWKLSERNQTTKSLWQATAWEQALPLSFLSCLTTVCFYLSPHVSFILIHFPLGTYRNQPPTSLSCICPSCDCRSWNRVQNKEFYHFVYFERWHHSKNVIWKSFWITAFGLISFESKLREIWALLSNNEFWK